MNIWPYLALSVQSVLSSHPIANSSWLKNTLLFVQVCTLKSEYSKWNEDTQHQCMTTKEYQAGQLNIDLCKQTQVCLFVLRGRHLQELATEGPRDPGELHTLWSLGVSGDQYVRCWVQRRSAPAAGQGLQALGHTSRCQLLGRLGRGIQWWLDSV